MIRAMTAAVRFFWTATTGNRLRPWRSEYLRWRIETYSGKPAETLSARDFMRLFLAEPRQFFSVLCVEQPSAASGGQGTRVRRREFLGSLGRTGAGAGLQVGLPRWMRGRSKPAKVAEPAYRGADSLRAHATAHGAAGWLRGGCRCVEDG